MVKPPEDDLARSINRRPSLAPAQIRYLYLWVHPQWSSPWSWQGVDYEVEKYKEFTFALKEAPRAALVQVVHNLRSEFMQNKVYTRFIEKLKELDQYTLEQLGDRYLVWDETRFIDAKNSDHVKKLVRKFNLLRANQENFVLDSEKWIAKEPKYLAKISVFGKERDTCSLGQASRYALHNLTSIVRYHAQELPSGIIPPTPTNPFPGDSNATYIFK